MSVDQDSTLLLRSVRLKAPDRDRFDTAFAWLMERVGAVPGCALISSYRATDDADEVLIAEWWESAEAMAAAYAELGDVPFEFMERAGNPAFLEDRMWSPDLTVGDPAGRSPA
jgi:hypothetical protein